MPEPVNAYQDYTHPKLGEEITAIGGHYVFVKEVRLPYQNREILYMLGYAVSDSSCCGVGGCAYVCVAGFICDWKYRLNADQMALSRVEPVRKPMHQKEIKSLIRQQERVQQVNFN